MALLYSSGIRVSELTRLKRGDIYYSIHCIYISRSKNRSDRYAVLFEKAYGLLVDYIRVFHPYAIKDWLFLGEKTGKHIHPQYVYNTFKKWLKVMNLSEAGYTLHSLVMHLGFISTKQIRT